MSHQWANPFPTIYGDEDTQSDLDPVEPDVDSKGESTEADTRYPAAWEDNRPCNEWIREGNCHE